jgi:hypothetical protein
MERSLDTRPAARAESTVSEESLVPDVRAHLTPAQMVERKLVSLLQSTSLPVSALQSVRRRGPA